MGQSAHGASPVGEYDPGTHFERQNSGPDAEGWYVNVEGGQDWHSLKPSGGGEPV